jgi:hypothetical protein
LYVRLKEDVPEVTGAELAPDIVLRPEYGSRIVAEDLIAYPPDCADYTIGLPCFSKILNAPVPIATKLPSSS